MSQSQDGLRARLCHLQLGSPRPELLARFYAQVLGMTLDEKGGAYICRGVNRCLVFTPGTANTMLSAGYEVPHASTLRLLAQRTTVSRIPMTAVERALFEEDAVAFQDPDGNRMTYGVPAASQVLPDPGVPQARLQHVVVGSTDVGRMVSFYTNVVGLRESDEVRDEQGGLRTSFMRSDEEHHSFAVFQTSQNRLDHHCYEVQDWNGIRDWADRLAAHGVQVKWGPGRHGPGNNLFVFFHDPDGNWVELSAELERVAADRPVGIWKHEERTLNQWGRGYLRS